jgi:arylsulfatase A-like enzyme
MTSIPAQKQPSLNYFWLAAWFGILAGLVEGLLYLGLQAAGSLVYTNAQILWFAPVVNSLLYLLVGSGLWIGSRIFPKLPWLLVAVFAFSMLTFLDWLGVVLLEKLYRWALILLSAGLAVVITRNIASRLNAWLRFSRRSLPWLAGIVLLTAILLNTSAWLVERRAVADLPPAAPGAPNVVLIVVDTLRSDHLSSNGYERATTPNLDALAAQGVSFQNAYSTSSYSLPSHVSLLTGKNIYEHAIEWDRPKALVDEPIPTLSEMMQKFGYRTGGFSANLFWVTREQGFDRGFVYFEDYFENLADMLIRPFFSRILKNAWYSFNPFSDIIGRRYAEEINRSALNWAAQDTDKPFFIFINYLDVHDPYLPPQPYRSMFSEQENPGGILNNDLGRQDPQLSPEELQSEIDAYDGAIAYVDAQLGELVRQLEEQTKGNLLVVVTSDHGEAFGEHGVYLHGMSLYREEVHVPLLIYAPERAPAGLSIQQPVSIISIPSTVIQLASGDQAKPFSAPSLSEFWSATGQVSEWPDPLLELAMQDWKPAHAPVTKGWIKSVVSPEWQFIAHEVLDPELYDLSKDLLQAKNLAEQPGMAGIVETFQARISQVLQKSGLTP